ncbi:MAG: hypothetical protein ACOCXQ_04075 [Patescibacteria group bacterium]
MHYKKWEKQPEEGGKRLYEQYYNDNVQPLIETISQLTQALESNTSEHLRNEQRTALSEHCKKLVAMDPITAIDTFRSYPSSTLALALQTELSKRAGATYEPPFGYTISYSHTPPVVTGRWERQLASEAIFATARNLKDWTMADIASEYSQAHALLGHGDDIEVRHVKHHRKRTNGGSVYLRQKYVQRYWSKEEAKRSPEYMFRRDVLPGIAEEIKKKTENAIPATLIEPILNDKLQEVANGEDMFARPFLCQINGETTDFRWVTEAEFADMVRDSQQTDRIIQIGTDTIMLPTEKDTDARDVENNNKDQGSQDEPKVKLIYRLVPFTEFVASPDQDDEQSHDSDRIADELILEIPQKKQSPEEICQRAVRMYEKAEQMRVNGQIPDIKDLQEFEQWAENPRIWYIAMQNSALQQGLDQGYNARERIGQTHRQLRGTVPSPVYLDFLYKTLQIRASVSAREHFRNMYSLNENLIHITQDEVDCKLIDELANDNPEAMKTVMQQLLDGFVKCNDANFQGLLHIGNLINRWYPGGQVKFHEWLTADPSTQEQLLTCITDTYSETLRLGNNYSSQVFEAVADIQLLFGLSEEEMKTVLNHSCAQLLMSFSVENIQHSLSQTQQSLPDNLSDYPVNDHFRSFARRFNINTLEDLSNWKRMVEGQYHGAHDLYHLLHGFEQEVLLTPEDMIRFPMIKLNELELLKREGVSLDLPYDELAKKLSEVSNTFSSDEVYPWYLEAAEYFGPERSLNFAAEHDLSYIEVLIGYCRKSDLNPLVFFDQVIVPALKNRHELHEITSVISSVSDRLYRRIYEQKRTSNNGSKLSGSLAALSASEIYSSWDRIKELYHELLPFIADTIDDYDMDPHGFTPVVPHVL